MFKHTNICMDVLIFSPFYTGLSSLLGLLPKKDGTGGSDDDDKADDNVKITRRMTTTIVMVKIVPA